MPRGGRLPDRLAADVLERLSRSLAAGIDPRRAWAGETAIAKVDVSVDNGATWQPARLVGAAVPYAWRRFEFTFTAKTPETRTILSRATDAKGQAQPVVPQWNPSGYLWNAPDTIRIEVKA